MDERSAPAGQASTTLDDVQWRARLLLQLVGGGASGDWARARIDDALREADEAGTSAHALHGDPDDVAETLLAQRPVEELAATADERSHDAYRTALGAAVLGAAGVMVQTVLEDGWTTTPEARAVVAYAASAALVFVAAYAVALRSAGRTRAARIGWVLVATGLVAMIAGVRSLPTGHLTPPLPAPTGVVAVGIAALFVRRVCAAVVDRSGEDWFADLATRLVGRHDLRPALARSLAATSREHWEQVRAGHPADADPSVEFGDLDLYAAALAEGRPRRPRLPQRFEPYYWRFMATVVVVATIAGALDGAVWWVTLVYCLFSVGAVPLAVGEVREQRRRRAREHR